MASTFCAPDVVKTLLDAGAKVNDADIRGMTPIQFAVSSESAESGRRETLLKAGADVNAKSSVGETALDWAMKFGNKEVIAALTSAGAREGVPYTAPQLKPAGERTVARPWRRRRDLTAWRRSSSSNPDASAVITSRSPGGGAAARGAGVHVDESAGKGFVKMMEGEMVLQSKAARALDTGGGTDGPYWKLMALASERYPSSLLTDTLVAYLAHNQRHDGSWWFGGISRAPFEEGRWRGPRWRSAGCRSSARPP